MAARERLALGLQAGSLPDSLPSTGSSQAQLWNQLCQNVPGLCSIRCSGLSREWLAAPVFAAKSLCAASFVHLGATDTSTSASHKRLHRDSDPLASISHSDPSPAVELYLWSGGSHAHCLSLESRTPEPTVASYQPESGFVNPQCRHMAKTQGLPCSHMASAWSGKLQPRQPVGNCKLEGTCFLWASPYFPVIGPYEGLQQGGFEPRPCPELQCVAPTQSRL